MRYSPLPKRLFKSLNNLSSLHAKCPPLLQLLLQRDEFFAVKMTLFVDTTRRSGQKPRLARAAM